MYLCYVDESGTPDIPGNTSHYILAGLAVPIQNWKDCDLEVESVKQRYGLPGEEVHVAWLLRPYPEQRHIRDFERLDHQQRRAQVAAIRTGELLRLQRAKNPRLYKQTRKNFAATEKYVHLTLAERLALVEELALLVSRWDFARLFAECIDKVHFDPVRTGKTVGEQAFEQVVSRFQHYLRHVSAGADHPLLGLLIHDNNDTVARKHTALMKRYHASGTLWTGIENIMETPLFVDSELTSMVQIADLSGYALRRYLENGDEELFDAVFSRADRKFGTVVGVRHFTKQPCSCRICATHRRAGSS